MNKLFKSALCIVSVFVIVFSMFPLSAFAVSQDFTVSIQKPEFDDNSVYIEFLLYNPSTGDYHVKVFTVYAHPEMNEMSSMYNTEAPTFIIDLYNDSFTIGHLPVDTVTFYCGAMEAYDNNKNTQYYNFTLSGTSISKSYRHTDYGSGYFCISYHVYGAYYQVYDHLDVSGSPNTEFRVLYAETASIYDTLFNIGRIANQMYLQDNEILLKFNDIIAEFNQTQQGQALTMQQIEDVLSIIRIMSADVILIREDLQKQYEELLAQGESISEIVVQLNQVNSYLNSLLVATNEIRDYTAWIWESSLEIQYYCEMIYNLLNSGSDKEEPPTVDTSQFDNYYDVENELVGDGAEDVEGAISVDMNNNAMSVIWNIVQRFVNSHEKVIGFILTILSFGLLALILGR